MEGSRGAWANLSFFFCVLILSSFTHACMHVCIPAWHSETNRAESTKERARACSPLWFPPSLLSSPLPFPSLFFPSFPPSSTTHRRTRLRTDGCKRGGRLTEGHESPYVSPAGHARGQGDPPRVTCNCRRADLAFRVRWATHPMNGQTALLAAASRVLRPILLLQRTTLLHLVSDFQSTWPGMFGGCSCSCSCSCEGCWMLDAR